MAPRAAIEDLKHREYWTPGEAARVLGRSAAYWSRAFDDPATVVTGYVEGGRGDATRHLSASSCRAYLDGKAAESGGWDPEAQARRVLGERCVHGRRIAGNPG